MKKKTKKKTKNLHFSRIRNMKNFCLTKYIL